MKPCQRNLCFFLNMSHRSRNQQKKQEKGSQLWNQQLVNLVLMRRDAFACFPLPWDMIPEQNQTVKFVPKKKKTQWSGNSINCTS